MDEFEILLAECRTALERFVKFKIGNKYDAEDVIQEACLSAYKKFGSLQNKASFKAWIISIAKNKCNDYYRKKASDMSIPIDELSESVLSTGRHGFSERTVVSDTLEKLGDKDKQILYLYFFKELPQEEIGRRLNIPVGTVKSRLHHAKKNFKEKYPYRPKPKGELIMKKLPDIMPEYKITESNKAAFDVVFEELPNWFIVPKVGEEINWGSYDMPSRRITEKVHSKVTTPVLIHGIEGVEISTVSEYFDKDWADTPEHVYYAQLTDTHCRWLGESYIDKNGAKRLLTFLDGDDFMDEWGFGEDNCGTETHLSADSGIMRNGDIITAADEKYLFGTVGRYDVELNGKKFDTVCIMEIFENGAATEQFVDRNGKTVLWRRFNRNDWAFPRYGKMWEHMLPDNDKLSINGQTYVHWYDCISDHVL